MHDQVGCTLLVALYSAQGVTDLQPQNGSMAVLVIVRAFIQSRKSTLLVEF